MTKTKSEFIKIHKKYKKSKTSNNSGGGSGGGENTPNSGRYHSGNNSARPSPRPRSSGVDSLNSSFSDIVINTAVNQIENHQKHKYEHEIVTLKSQLNEQKLKEMEMYHEKNALLKLIEQYKTLNQVIFFIKFAKIFEKKFRFLIF